MNKTIRGKILPPGKLPIKVLDRLLKKYTTPRGKGVLIGPSAGIDCAVIESKGELLLAKTDPITFVAEDIGLYAIHINANDIAVMGGTPKWFLATILMPVGKTSTDDVEAAFRQIKRTCNALGISFCGGHTEITPAVLRPVVVGQMLGEVTRKRLTSAAGARKGDDIILTKGVPIEALSVIARVKKDELKGIFPERFIRRCANAVKNPGISVVKDAGIMLNSGRVHSMHDPTEGGILMGLYELALASGVGLVVKKENIPVLKEARGLLGYFGLDPLGAIASGALVATVNPRDTDKILKALSKNSIAAAKIGKVTDKMHGVKMEERGKLTSLKAREQDELTKIL